MKLDRSTFAKLTKGFVGTSGGAWGQSCSESLNEVQLDHERAAKAMTNKTPISEAGAKVVVKLMERVETGDLTMEQAAKIINSIDAAPEKQLAHNPHFRIKTKRVKRIRRK